jgi:primosomal protein N' (replication factor Y)
MKKIAEVAVPINLNKTFSYIITEDLMGKVDVGKRVLVPFNNRKLTGYVVQLKKKSEFENIKEIIRVLDDTPLFLAKDLEFFKWLSAYYMTPLAEVIKTALPSGINQQSKKYYSITKTGGDYIKDKGAKNLELLWFLKDNGPVSESMIKRRFDSPNIPSLLKRLSKKGLIDSREVTSEKTLKKSFIKHIILRKENKGYFVDYISSIKKNAKKKLKLCRFLLDNEDVSYPELTKRFQNVKKIIDTLCELNYVQVRLKEKEPDLKCDFEPYDKKITFTKEQKVSIKAVKAALDSDDYHPFLLHGITGSGKTEIYIQAVKRAVERGKGVIILVPEIALTPHFIRRFVRHFKNIAVMHSSISPRTRYQYYFKILNGEVRVVIGARSAIFAPFKDLGLIIVDEEHEAAYKQDEGFKYNARDVALLKAKVKKCTVVLGSATPSIESYHNAVTGKYKHLRLKERANKSSLPEIKVVDMKKEKVEGDKKSLIVSKTLRKTIEENLKSKKQTMLFLNRRGHSSFIVCYDCGEAETCPNCTISLTYHRADNNLVCHYCGFKKDLLGICSSCKSSRLRPVGFGTQRVYEIVKGYFPAANIFRMDSDTMSKRGSHIDFYKKMDNKEIDIVIGTQMIAKGHDFENVTAVGILNADAGLAMPDFRAEEKSFSLITQVSGRAGRGAFPGRVVIQTLNPENDYINYALSGDAEKYYKKELELRNALKFPPFSRLVNIKIIARHEKYGDDAYNKLKAVTKKALKDKKYKSISVMGPAPCPIYKVKNKFRWQMFAKSKDSRSLHLFAGKLKDTFMKEISASYVKISIDVDPVNML